MNTFVETVLRTDPNYRENQFVESCNEETRQLRRNEILPQHRFLYNVEGSIVSLQFSISVLIWLIHDEQTEWVFNILCRCLFMIYFMVVNESFLNDLQ